METSHVSAYRCAVKACALRIAGNRHLGGSERADAECVHGRFFNGEYPYCVHLLHFVAAIYVLHAYLVGAKIMETLWGCIEKKTSL